MSVNETVTKPQYQFSVKLEMNAKGYIQPTVHCYDDNNVDACDQAIMALNYVSDKIKKIGFKLASEIDNNEIKTVKSK